MGHGDGESREGSAVLAEAMAIPEVVGAGRGIRTKQLDDMPEDAMGVSGPYSLSSDSYHLAHTWWLGRHQGLGIDAPEPIGQIGQCVQRLHLGVVLAQGCEDVEGVKQAQGSQLVGHLGVDPG